MNDIAKVWHLYSHSVLSNKKAVLKDRYTTIEIKSENGTLSTTFQRMDGPDTVQMKKVPAHPYFLGQNKGRYRVELAKLGTPGKELLYLKGYAKQDLVDGNQVDVFFGLPGELSGDLTAQPQGTFLWNGLPLPHEENLPHKAGNQATITARKVFLNLGGGDIELDIKASSQEGKGWYLRAVSVDYKRFECWFLPVKGGDKPLFCGQFYEYKFKGAGTGVEPANNPEKCSTGGTGGGNG